MLLSGPSAAGARNYREQLAHRLSDPFRQNSSFLGTVHALSADRAGRLDQSEYGAELLRQRR